MEHYYRALAVLAIVAVVSSGYEYDDYYEDECYDSLEEHLIKNWVAKGVTCETVKQYCHETPESMKDIMEKRCNECRRCSEAAGEFCHDRDQSCGRDRSALHWTCNPDDPIKLKYQKEMCRGSCVDHCLEAWEASPKSKTDPRCSLCPKLQEMDALCSKTDSWWRRIPELCKKTCGLCSCADHDSDCSHYRNDCYTTDTQLERKLSRSCQGTCPNHCPSACMDRFKPPICTEYSRYCFTEDDWLRSELQYWCRGTCRNLCV